MAPSWVKEIGTLFTRHLKITDEQPCGQQGKAKSGRPITYEQVIARKDDILNALKNSDCDAAKSILPENLSDAEKAMLAQWLIHPGKNDKPALTDIQTMEDLVDNLRIGVEAELITIAMYLTTTYSIRGERTGSELKFEGVKKKIYDVAIMEMGHLATAVNILSALGHYTNVEDIGRGLRFPTPLCGNLRPGSMFYLRKFSLDQIERFMDFELPGVTRELKTDSDGFKYADITSEPCYNENTIGQFYADIIDALNTLNPDFSGTPNINFNGNSIDNGGLSGSEQGGDGKQLNLYQIGEPAIPVTDLPTAIAACEFIVEQGEGDLPSTPDDLDGLDPFIDDDEERTAHYYTFLEIKEGRKIKKLRDSDGNELDGFKINGDVLEVPTDDQVYNMVDDPTVEMFSSNPHVSSFAQAFSDAYLHVLRTIDSTVLSGSGPGLMKALEYQAMANMETPIPNSGEPPLVVGTPFQISVVPSTGLLHPKSEI